MNCKKLFVALLLATMAVTACKKISPIEETETIVAEDIASFKEIATIDLGGETSAEISAYDPSTKKLFVVSNEGGAKVEVVDLTNYPTVAKLITLTYPGNAGINSVAVNNGLLAIALDGADKQGMETSSF